jgi:hypothetical protein
MDSKINLETGMTERKLLELAAKAAGVPLRDLDNRYDCWDGEPIQIHWEWNPLANGDQALRLAVKLGINICCHHALEKVIATCGFARCVEFLFGQQDADTATRKAIVRAAAEIGKTL